MSTPRKSQPVPVKQQDNAALAALGLLPPREAAEVSEELVNRMRQAASLLAESVAPIPPPPSLKDRLMKRIANYHTMKPLADVRSHDDTWKLSGIPGVDIKPLFKDKQTGISTYLLRMEPGSHLPAHYHHDVEQCLVLKGDIRWDELVYEEGDFVVMGKDTPHPELHTVYGNILLLMAGHNEFAHA